MNHLTLATSILVLVCSTAAYSQSAARANQTLGTPTMRNDARTAIEQLKRLQADVIVYRSLGEFEESGKLARVPLQTFEEQLSEVTIQVQEIVAYMPDGNIKNQLINSLASYRDGAFWWRRIDQPRVVSVSAIAFERKQVTPSDSAFISTIPYTVIIHWRQAARFLSQAERASP